jgi:hypothetical protein
VRRPRHMVGTSEPGGQAPGISGSVTSVSQRTTQRTRRRTIALNPWCSDERSYGDFRSIHCDTDRIPSIPERIDNRVDNNSEHRSTKSRRSHLR